MRTIKFRGRDTRTNEYRYGFVESLREGLFEKVWINTPMNGFCEIFPVDPNSIAQLIGVDVDGNEVYEGDKVVSEYGDNIVARLVDNLPPKPELKETTK